MPRYFFHLRNDVDVDDEDGLELPGLDEARAQAAKYARNMAAVSVDERGKINLHHKVEIADERGAILCFVEFGDVVSIES